MWWTDAEEDLQAIAEAAGAVAPAFPPDGDIVAPALPPDEALAATEEADMPEDPPPMRRCLPSCGTSPRMLPN
jgi:hypothetical protein